MREKQRFLISVSCDLTAFFSWNSHQSENHLDPILVNYRQGFKPPKQSSILITGLCMERLPGEVEDAGAGCEEEAPQSGGAKPKSTSNSLLLKSALKMGLSVTMHQQTYSF